MSTFAFQAVLFDLDGTLVATERYWPDAARAATLRFFRERGLTRAVPSTQQWLLMVGQPMESAFAQAFPDLEAPTRAALLAECAKEESQLLGRGRASLLAGAEELLTSLASKGVRMGVASNCGMDYLSQMMGGLGLSRWIHEARCLSSPGIGNKADMIADLLLEFDTRSAVMVGDTRGDRDSAWANGLPHVHIPRFYVGTHEVRAEATLDGIDELEDCLNQRDRALRAVLAAHPDAETYAVIGLPLAGKTLLAADLARLAQAEGRALEVLDDPEPEAASDADLLLAVTAEEGTLVRRAKGLRCGMGPVDTLTGESLPAARARLAAARPTVHLDMTSAIAPTQAPQTT